MNLFKTASFMNKGVRAVLLAMLAFGTAAAQESTVTTVTKGQPSSEIQLKNAEIVYVEGNDLVLKLEDGKIEHVVVPDSDKFNIDGNELSVRELVPGTKLTQSITTTTTPHYVNSVRTIEGKVWFVNAPTSVILAFPDNTHKMYNVPSHTKFNIDGEEKTVFDLKRGMKVKATVITDEEQTVIEQTKMAYGRAPQMAMPTEVGSLLFAAPSEPNVTLASAEQPAETLPETASPLPLMALLGILAIGMSMMLGAARRVYAL